MASSSGGSTAAKTIIVYGGVIGGKRNRREKNISNQSWRRNQSAKRNIGVMKSAATQQCGMSS